MNLITTTIALGDLFVTPNNGGFYIVLSLKPKRAKHAVFVYTNFRTKCYYETIDLIPVQGDVRLARAV